MQQRFWPPSLRLRTAVRQAHEGPRHSQAQCDPGDFQHENIIVRSGWAEIENAHGWRFRSMAALITGKISGTCWTSSSVTGIFSPATNPLGSRLAAARMPGSSKVRYWRFCSANSADCTSVLFPVWRAPLTRTAGVSANPSRSRSIRWRRSIALESTKKWMIINHKVDDYHVCPAFCQCLVQPRLLSLSFDFRTIVTHC